MVTIAATPRRDRIARVRFSGLRTAAGIQLDCEPMTVLIGPNGVGKSTLIEGLELLRKIPSGPEFIHALHDDHGGVSHLLRHGESELKLGVELTDDVTSLSYDLTLARRNGGFTLAHESLHHEGEPLFVRDSDTMLMAPAVWPQEVAGTTHKLMPWPTLATLSMSMTSPFATRVSNALASVQVHVPFATQARWFGPGVVPDRNMRNDNIVQSTDRVDRGGANLANAFHALRNRPDWLDTLDTIKLLIDDDIADVTTPASASGGSIGLAVSYRSSGTVPAFALSDGTLALLAVIAIARLDGGDTPRSLVVLDEPDLHLHPSAISQVVALLEECSVRHPVVMPRTRTACSTASRSLRERRSCATSTSVAGFDSGARTRHSSIAGSRTIAASVSCARKATTGSCSPRRAPPERHERLRPVGGQVARRSSRRPRTSSTTHWARAASTATRSCSERRAKTRQCVAHVPRCRAGSTWWLP